MQARFYRRISAVLLFLVGLATLPGWSQYTDQTVINDLGGPQEFARRRQELAVGVTAKKHAHVRMRT